MYVFVAEPREPWGRPLVSQLIGAGHVVTATTRTPASR
jgi:uncharacterized protein YbjT (DUF2867 family)